MPGGLMEKVSFPVSSLFGDHHVLEVRRILLARSGVAEVYASSCFHVIEVSFDPAQISQADIAAVLEAAGYFADLPQPVEATAQISQRQAMILEQTQVVGFQEKIAIQKRTAWPCPGMGLLKVQED
jgi:copper chaperone CopZ